MIGSKSVLGRGFTKIAPVPLPAPPPTIQARELHPAGSDHRTGALKLLRQSAQEGDVGSAAQESKDHREKALEEVNKSIDFQEHAQQGPAQQHNGYTPQEEDGPLELVSLEEEGKCPPQANDEGEASQEQQISESQEYGVKVQEYPKEDEEDTEAGDAHTNLLPLGDGDHASVHWGPSWTAG